MNIQQKYNSRIIVLKNLLERITPLRGREKSYSLKGVITQEERNAIVVGLQEIKNRLASLRVGGGKGEENEDNKRNKTKS